MLTNGAARVGISAHKRRNDLFDFAEELDMIQDLGVESVELPIYDMDIVVGGRIRMAQLNALKRACSDRTVSYSVHGPLAINLMDEPYRLARHFEVLKASIEIAAEVGAENYVVHSGLVPMQQDDGREAAYARQREWLAKAGDLARDHGIVLCVETLFGGYQGRVYASTATRLARELFEINHPQVMATLDFSHSYIRAGFHGDDFVADVKAIAPYARHLHMHDSFGRQDDIWMYTDGERVAYGHGDLHLPVGWGDIPWQRLVQECVFPEGVVFNIELKERYWYAAQECVDVTRALAQRAQIVGTKAA